MIKKSNADLIKIITMFETEGMDERYLIIMKLMPGACIKPSKNNPLPKPRVLLYSRSISIR